ncbi:MULTISPECIES: hypothetical protein [Wolbachia]|uniref:Uncharacterized protein n=1 Tax=Wolbachia pipientis TaxID=955 RepID=A0A7G5CDA2_WOLPI|nr:MULTISPECIES: hypothetical protein [Wolbachia]MDE5061118.1 hypothetical protein [Wolbachia endosymbiont of Drosophila nikananu]QMV47186.1 hypothetical protein HC356_04030 [Wolbachia pipientis]
MLKANNQGKLEGKFTVPSSVPAGTKLVQFFGSQGSYGEATYTGRGVITTEERRRVTVITDIRRDETTVVSQRYDPLAQTFTLNESRHIAGVDLWFTNKGEKRVVAQIRETSVGMPTQMVIAEGYILPTDINTNGTAIRITWSPVWCEAGQEYALVLLTDDANTAVKIAELGKHDSVNNRWVTSQPYQVGVLLSSSNASTWTPHQNRDLTFRLLAAKFTEVFHVFDLGKVTANNTSDLIALANIDLVSSDTNVELTLVEVGKKQEHSLSDNLPIALRSRLNGELVVKATLRGSEKRSPVFYPGLQLILGEIAENADYVTRSIPAGSNTKVTITYEASIPGTADIKTYVQQSNSEWQLVDLTIGKPAGDSWVERTHVLTSFNANETRIKLSLSGTVEYRPKVRALRVVIS